MKKGDEIKLNRGTLRIVDISEVMMGTGPWAVKQVMVKWRFIGSLMETVEPMEKFCKFVDDNK